MKYLIAYAAVLCAFVAGVWLEHSANAADYQRGYAARSAEIVAQSDADRLKNNAICHYAELACAPIRRKK